MRDWLEWITSAVIVISTAPLVAVPATASHCAAQAWQMILRARAVEEAGNRYDFSDPRHCQAMRSGLAIRKQIDAMPISCNHGSTGDGGASMRELERAVNNVCAEGQRQAAEERKRSGDTVTRKSGTNSSDSGVKDARRCIEVTSKGKTQYTLYNACKFTVVAKVRTKDLRPATVGTDTYSIGRQGRSSVYSYHGYRPVVSAAVGR